MVKIEGFDKLNRDIKDAQKALDELGDELGTVSFNPDDPVSIEGAIATMEQTSIYFLRLITLYLIFNNLITKTIKDLSSR